MSSFSRRQLAHYAVEKMLEKSQLEDLAAQLAAALIATGRQRDLDLLLADIDQELEDRGLLAKAYITSAYPLSAKLRQDLKSAVKKLTGSKDVIIEHQLDKDVIGGIKVETANHSWDKTLRRKLMDIKENL